MAKGITCWPPTFFRFASPVAVGRFLFFLGGGGGLNQSKSNLQNLSIDQKKKTQTTRDEMQICGHLVVDFGAST